MKKFVFFLSIFVTLSCSQKDNARVRFEKWAKKGQVISHVTCKDYTGLSYSLYLPSTYNPKQQYPILYVFDPKGEGAYAVSMFQAIAERFGFIVAGSNNSKNGLKPDEIQFILDALFKDTRELLSIDQQQIFTCGFSGGARVACSAALSYQFITGVIACSGGFQPSSSSRTFNFIGVAGNADMNYLEMKSLEIALNDWPSRHVLMIYDGKHAWPPRSVLETTLTSLVIMTDPRNQNTSTSVMVQSYIDTSISLAEKYLVTNTPENQLMAYQTLTNVLKVIGSIPDTVKIIEKINSLDKEKISAANANEEAMEKYEMSKQQELLAAFSKQPATWWKKEMKQLEENKLHGNNINTRLVASRIMAFVSLVSYSYVNSAMNQNDWNAASMFLDIYGIADPENPDYNYFMTCYWSHNGNTVNAIESLKKAKQNGYQNMQLLRNDPLLQMLSGNKEFVEITMNEEPKK